MGSLFNQEKREVSEERRNKTYNEHISGISKAAVLCNSSMYGDGCRISAEPCTVRKCATVSRNRCSLCGDPGYTGFSVLPGGAVSGLCSADVFWQQATVFFCLKNRQKIFQRHRMSEKKREKIRERKKVTEKEKQMNRRNVMHVADRKEAEKPAFCECGFAVQRAFQEGVSCEI